MNRSAATGGELAGWARAWAAGRRPAPQVVVTRGEGAHLAALRDSCPGALVLAAVPAGSDRALESRILAAGAGPPFQSALTRLLATGVDTYRADPPAHLVPLVPGAEDWDAQVATAIRNAKLERATRYNVGALWIENLIANLPRVVCSATLWRLAGALAGAPIVVAGAGPSLAAALDAIAAHRDRGVLLAASSALRPLVRHGLVPDGVVMIEGRDCTHHFEGVPESALREMVLFAIASTHPMHLALPWSDVVFFHGNPSEWLAHAAGDAVPIPCGSNVGTTALVIAWSLGGVPVLAAGLDFATPGGAYYVSASGSRAEAHEGAEVETVAGWDGSPLQATVELCSYREQTESVIAAIHATEPRASFFSITRAGARIDGMRLVDWGALAPRLEQVESAALARAVEGAPRGLEDPIGASERLSEIEQHALELIEALATDPLGPQIASALLDPPDPLLDIVLGGAHATPQDAVEACRREVRRLCGCARAAFAAPAATV